MAFHNIICMDFTENTLFTSFGVIYTCNFADSKHVPQTITWKSGWLWRELASIILYAGGKMYVIGMPWLCHGMGVHNMLCHNCFYKESLWTL